MISTVHLAMKFLRDEMQVLTLKGDKMHAHECFKESLKRKNLDKTGEMDYEPEAKTQSKVMFKELDCREDVKKGGHGHLGRNQEGVVRTTKLKR